MRKQNYNVIGVMSGTSLDGIDLAHVAFDFSSKSIGFSLLECETATYPQDWVSALKSAIGLPHSQLEKLDRDYTGYLAGTIVAFIEKHRIRNIDAICSHGHTVLHRPQEGVTLQIGNLPEIAALTGEKVVCDFRTGDVDLGGQGAPLVPIGDRLLFGDYDYCLNLGGFSNVSFEHDGKRIAFDISPVNTVLNFYADFLGMDYDDKGLVASGGNVNIGLLEALDVLPYYSLGFPKSLGFEFVRDTILPLLARFDIPIDDILRTFCEHIAIQVAAALPRKTGRMLITGGGAYHDFLIGRIRALLPETDIVIPEKKIVEFKEALIFALLGVLKLRGENNVLASVTGAAHDHSSGKIYG
jgi:anhydro-N-acetylmuramic acid kinase